LNKLIRNFVILFVGAMPTATVATECASFVGQRPTVLSFDNAVRSLPNIPPKGEFETTAQFEARKAAALAGLPQEIIVSKKPDKPEEHAVYDADSQQLRIKSYFFTDLPIIDYWDAIQPTEFYEALKPGLTYSNYGVTISYNGVKTGSYEAQNSYGARWTIEKITRDQKGIYERAQPFRAPSSLFPVADQSPYFLGSLPVAPESARLFRQNLMTAFVVRPSTPYVVRSTYEASYGRTVQNPRETTVNSTILIGDIRCGLLIGTEGVVLSAYETR
jgi:hypothetical protein